MGRGGAVALVVSTYCLRLRSICDDRAFSDKPPDWRLAGLELVLVELDPPNKPPLGLLDDPEPPLYLDLLLPNELPLDLLDDPEPPLYLELDPDDLELGGRLLELGRDPEPPLYLEPELPLDLDPLEDLDPPLYLWASTTLAVVKNKHTANTIHFHRCMADSFHIDHKSSKLPPGRQRKNEVSSISDLHYTSCVDRFREEQ